MSLELSGSSPVVVAKTGLTTNGVNLFDAQCPIVGDTILCVELNGNII